MLTLNLLALLWQIPIKLIHQYNIFPTSDDTVILLWISIGLKRALDTFVHPSEENQLDVNYTKSKTMAFANQPPKHSWSISNHATQQVQCYICLGVILQAKGNKRAHAKDASQNAHRSYFKVSSFQRVSIYTCSH